MQYGKIHWLGKLLGHMLPFKSVEGRKERESLRFAYLNWCAEPVQHHSAASEDLESILLSCCSKYSSSTWCACVIQSFCLISSKKRSYLSWFFFSVGSAVVGSQMWFLLTFVGTVAIILKNLIAVCCYWVWRPVIYMNELHKSRYLHRCKSCLT